MPGKTTAVKFNIDDVIKDMLGGAKEIIAAEWKNIKATAELFLNNKKKRLRMLAEYRLAGEINNKELLEFLEDEKTMFSSEMAALKLITKSMAQKAANKALDILYDAIQKWLPIK